MVFVFWILPLTTIAASPLSSTAAVSFLNRSGPPFQLARLPLHRQAYGLSAENVKQILLRAFDSPVNTRSRIHDFQAAVDGDAVAGSPSYSVTARDVQELASSATRQSDFDANPISAHSVEVVRAIMSDIADLFYTVRIRVGNPPVSTRMIVDTGSADMWVRRSLYSPTKSATSLATSQSDIVLQYGQGVVFGQEVEDTVCFGNVCFANETLVVAYDVRNIGNELYIDGLLGLALSTLTHTSGESFLDSLLTRKAFKHLAFGLQLHSSETSFLAFGEFENVVAAAPNTTAGLSFPVSGPYWMLDAEIHDTHGWNTVETAVLDSGTSLLCMPSRHYERVIKGMLGANLSRQCRIVNGFLTCACDVRLSPITFDFTAQDGRSISISLGSKDFLSFIGETEIENESVRICRFDLVSSFMDLWILGDVFLRRVFAVHDVTLQRLVLFPQKPEDVIKQSSSPGGGGASLPNSNTGEFGFATLVTGVGGILAVCAALLLTLFLLGSLVYWRWRFGESGGQESFVEENGGAVGRGDCSSVYTRLEGKQ